MADIATLVESARENFNVLDALKGQAYPEDSVTVDTDVRTGYQINVLRRKIRKLEHDLVGEDDNTERERIDDEINSLQQQIAVLKDKLKETQQTFHLRGIPPQIIESIQTEAREKFGDDGVDFGPGAIWANDNFLAAHILRVESADGSVDEHKWTHEDVATLRGFLPDESFEKVATLMQELSFAASYFDATVTADFLSKS